MDTSHPVDAGSQQAGACIFCGPDAARDLLIRENGFDGHKCRVCGLIFVSPRPSLSEIADLYGHDEAHVSASSHLAAGFTKRIHARHTLNILKHYRASGDMLDIGAGAGFFLDEARRHGFNPHAIEFNQTQIRHIRDVLRIPCVAKPLSDDPFLGKSFDVIYHCDVVSHFYDPFAEFRAFHHALKDEGLLVFETGNLGETDHRYLRLFDRFQYPDHLFFFSSDNIVTLLSRTGFELVHIHRYSILADLWIGRLRTQARRLARRLLATTRKANPTDHASSNAGPWQEADSQGFLHVAKRVDQYINHLVRYRLGRMLPKGSRPQTMIVIARKAIQSRA